MSQPGQDGSQEVFSNETLVAISEIDELYKLILSKYPDMEPVVVAAMIQATMTRIGDHPIFTVLNGVEHRDARVYHPKYGNGTIKSFDDTKKAIVKFDNRDETTKVSPYSVRLLIGESSD